MEAAAAIEEKIVETTGEFTFEFSKLIQSAIGVAVGFIWKEYFMTVFYDPIRESVRGEMKRTFLEWIRESAILLLSVMIVTILAIFAMKVASTYAEQHDKSAQHGKLA